MTTAIDSAGRLVIPKAVREAAGLRPGTPLDVRFRDGRIEIEPAPVAIAITHEGGVAVAVAKEPLPVLKAEVVTQTRGDLRAERG
jgi:AbrB family looped-hinge helix DNA binding protein